MPAIRHLLSTQIIITASAFVVGIACAYFTLYPLLFCAGSAIATYNFWFIAQFVQRIIFSAYSASIAVRQFFGFTARFLFTGLILFGLIVWLHLPVAPIVVGITSVVASIAYWGVTKLPNKPAKEA